MNRQMNPPHSRRSGLLPRTAGKAAIALAFMTGTVAAGSLAAAEEPTTHELMAQIQKLQEQVEAMQTQTPAQAAQTQAETDGHALGRVLDDAEQRSSKPSAPVLLQGDAPEPFLAGYDEGRFVLRSADGDFELSPYIQLQIRNVTNIRGEDDAFDDWEQGFEIRRFKAGAAGHAFTPDLTYDFRMAFDRDAGVNGAGDDIQLDKAYIQYMPDELLGVDAIGPANNLGIRLGQYKDTTFYEETTSFTRQLAADRSLVNETLGGGNTDYVQGIGLVFGGERFKGILSYIDGANSDNTPYLNVMWDYGIAGRIDFLVSGDSFAPFKDFTARGTEENSTRIGAGFNYSADGDDRVLWHSVDVQYEADSGLGLFAAYYGRYADVAGDDGLDVGALAQVSQTLGDSDWEVFGRYDFTILDDEILVGTEAEDFFHEITLGVNKYWRGHDVKLTVDAVYLPNGNPGGNTGLGLRPSVGDELDQVSLRGQLQFLI